MLFSPAPHKKAGEGGRRRAKAGEPFLLPLRHKAGGRGMGRGGAISFSRKKLPPAKRAKAARSGQKRAKPDFRPRLEAALHLFQNPQISANIR
jgi:hypothetical protein